MVHACRHCKCLNNVDRARAMPEASTNFEFCTRDFVPCDGEAGPFTSESWCIGLLSAPMLVAALMTTVTTHESLSRWAPTRRDQNDSDPF